jgi:hypothetical protein
MPSNECAHRNAKHREEKIRRARFPGFQDRFEQICYDVLGCRGIPGESLSASTATLSFPCGRKKGGLRWPKSRNCRREKRSAPMICNAGRVSVTAVGAAYLTNVSRRNACWERNGVVKNGCANVAVIFLEKASLISLSRKRSPIKVISTRVSLDCRFFESIATFTDGHLTRHPSPSPAKGKNSELIRGTGVQGGFLLGVW